MKKYTLDTNLFIDAFRNADAEARLLDFHQRFAPAEYLNVVVALELRAGARTANARSRLERYVIQPFEQRDRVITPGSGAWKQAGIALAKLHPETSRSFCNDVLIAASCREHGVVLVTRNVRDFSRIAHVLSFEFVEAWP